MMQSTARSTSLIQYLSFKHDTPWQAVAVLLAFETIGCQHISTGAFVMLAMPIDMASWVARHDCLNAPHRAHTAAAANSVHWGQH